MQPCARFEEQFHRVQRWYGRLKLIARGEALSHDPACFTDEIYAFFLSCYHLKDWIKKDPAVVLQDKDKAVERFVTTTRCLAICADICNCTKHLVLDRPPRSGDVPFFEGNFSGIVTDKGVRGRTVFRVKTGAASVDVFALADDCMAAWENFIESEVRPSITK